MKKIKWGIDMGHNCPPDVGAVGIKSESHLTKEVGELVISKLRALGYEVVVCLPRNCTSPNQSLKARTDIANNAKCDYYVSIHFNAFPDPEANGTEVFAISPAGRLLAVPIVEEIASLGYRNRGVKNRNFFVLRWTNMPAVLIECCFLTNPKDMELYDAEAMSNAIVNGLVEGVGDLEPPSIRIDP